MDQANKGAGAKAGTFTELTAAQEVGIDSRYVIEWAQAHNIAKGGDGHFLIEDLTPLRTWASEQGYLPRSGAGDSTR